MSPPIRRICAGCTLDQTPLGRGLHSVRNARGVSLGLFCEDCVPDVMAHIAAIDRQHGAHITADGRYLCAPRGTPFDTPYPARPRAA